MHRGNCFGSGSQPAELQLGLRSRGGCAQEQLRRHNPSQLRSTMTALPRQPRITILVPDRLCTAERSQKGTAPLISPQMR